MTHVLRFYFNTEHSFISFVVNQRLCRTLYNMFWFHFPNNNPLVIVHSNGAAAADSLTTTTTTTTTIIIIIIIIIIKIDKQRIRLVET